MSVTFTPLHELALDLVQEDHTPVAGIEAEVRLLMGNGVSRGQITAALEQLREMHLVDAFVRRKADGGYDRFRRRKLKAGTEIWWRATEQGKTENSAWK